MLEIAHAVSLSFAPLPLPRSLSAASERGHARRRSRPDPSAIVAAASRAVRSQAAQGLTVQAHPDRVDARLVLASANVLQGRHAEALEQPINDSPG